MSCLWRPRWPPGATRNPIHERGNTMAAKKATTKKATSRKQASGKKASGKRASAKKSEKKMSGLDAAAKVLAEAGEPMRCQEMLERMAEKGYWKSPGGKTPAATLHAAITREINTKGQDARFKKTDRGLFAANK